MFKNNRYVTRGVNEEVDIRLQLIMWSMIDKLKDEGNKIVINQSQEVPEYSSIYEIEIEDVEVDYEIKIYVIDNGVEGSTMLFPWEYWLDGGKNEEIKYRKDLWLR